MEPYIPANGNKVLENLDKQTRQELVKTKFREIFEIMGYDVEHDHNLKDTPSRISKMYFNEIFKGNFDAPPKITVFPNTKKYDQIILLKDIEVKSTCSHHFQPFIGVAHIAYLPGENVIGLSKLSRIVDYYARRPQIQEELTEQVVDHVEALLKPKGVALVVECQHFCMKVRGVEEHESIMTTSAMCGVFKDNYDIRQEFLSLINKGK